MMQRWRTRSLVRRPNPGLQIWSLATRIRADGEAFPLHSFQDSRTELVSIKIGELIRLPESYRISLAGQVLGVRVWPARLIWDWVAPLVTGLPVIHSSSLVPRPS